MDLSRELPAPELLQSFDAVFHLAGIAHMRAAPEAYERLNYRAAVDLARRCEQSGVSCFVFLSSVRAMGFAAGEAPRAERDTSSPDSAYGLSKWQAECELRSEFAKSEMAVYILRPALVYGAGVGGNLQSLRRAVACGLPRPPEGGSRSMISAQDLVQLMCLLAREPQAGSHTWIVTDGQRYTLDHIYDVMRRSSGKGPGSAWLPGGVWRASVGLVDRLRRGAGQTLQERLFGTDLYDNSAVLAATPWRPRLTLEQVMVPGESSA